MNSGGLGRAFNLRDLGGLACADGRRTRPGLLYRSASLAEITPAQGEALAALDIGTVIDLRFNSERANHPSPWQAIGCRDYWCRDHEPAGGGDLGSILASDTLTAADSLGIMIRAYQDMPYLLTDGIRALFDAAAAGRGALLFHCTSGKDRTGIAAALLLTALGVAEDFILGDYMASLDFDILTSHAFRTDQAMSARRLEAIRPIYTVHPDYLAATFAKIAAEDGSIEVFLSRRAGIFPAQIEKVREQLLA